MKNNFIRSISIEDSNLRAVDGENNEMKVEFYASVFNKKSKLIKEYGRTFYEVIAPSAFDDVLAKIEREELDVYACVNHYPREIFSRLKNKTLTLEADEIGLKATAFLPDTQEYRDFYTQLKRGDFYESSFVYGIYDEEADVSWSEPDENGIKTRTITKVYKLRDVSIITHYGAFGDTNISLRELIEGLEQRTQEEQKTQENQKIYKPRIANTLERKLKLTLIK